jgi:hypothetical protein
MRAALFLLLSLTTMAADEVRHHLFSPTPRGAMRDLSTDRPDQTESPYTVPAGHLQIEMDLIHWTRDREDGVAYEALNITPINLKLGILEHADLQLIFESWSRETVREGGRRLMREGIGDFTIRWKQNLWGNDGGTTALAVMPFVTLPLRASELGREDAEAGIIIPVGWNLPHGLYLGMMTEWDWVHVEDAGHRHVWLNTITLGVEVTDRLGAYIEFTAIVYEDSAPWESTVDGGFTFALNDHTQFDIGCNVGVTRSAPDVQPFIGVTYRY